VTQGNKSYEDLKKELGGNDELFDSVLASAIPKQVVAKKIVEAVANGLRGDFKVYSYDQLKATADDLPDDVDKTRKEV